MYTEKGSLIAPLVAASVATESLATASSVIGRYVAVNQCVVKGLRVIVTTATSGAVGSLTVLIRPQHGSATGQITVGTFALPNSAATTSSAQTVLYKDFAGAVAQPGYEICALVSTAAGAGSALIEHIVEEDPETAANAPSMVLVS
jgi:hypothetical protein